MGSSYFPSNSSRLMAPWHAGGNKQGAKYLEMSRFNGGYDLSSDIHHDDDDVSSSLLVVVLVVLVVLVLVRFFAFFAFFVVEALRKSNGFLHQPILAITSSHVLSPSQKPPTGHILQVHAKGSLLVTFK